MTGTIPPNRPPVVKLHRSGKIADSVKA